ncbi:MAG: nucleotidyltransferase domain-containing protein, partial [Actinobacteria bacterium]|nr:nucleotidyltransferase domain-containing protein [Actinomycetota bacterium]
MPDELLSRQAFVEARLAARELLLERAIEVLEGAGAVEGHLLGSLARGEADELSDIDLWITFEDEDTPHAIRKRSGLYLQIAPVLLTHEAEANPPVGGKFSLVIFATETGPLMVDFQLSPLSTAVLESDAKRLFGTVALPEGDKQSTSRSGEVTRSERIDFLIAMASAALKY